MNLNFSKESLSIEAVDVEVIYGPAVLVGEQRVCRVAIFERGDVVGHQAIDLVTGARTRDHDFAHVADVKQPRTSSASASGSFGPGGSMALPTRTLTGAGAGKRR